MEIVRHMSDDELSEMLLEDDLRHLQPVSAQMQEWLHSATERPETFWRKQHTQIRSRIAGEHRTSWRPLAVWAAAAALVLMAVGLVNAASPGRIAAEPAPQAFSAQPNVGRQIQVDPDQDLLLAVESSLSSGVPDSLQPATLLAGEISKGGVPASAHTYSEENTNED